MNTPVDTHLYPPVARRDAVELSRREIRLVCLLCFVEMAMRTSTLSAVCVVDLA